jgi:transposase
LLHAASFAPPPAPEEAKTLSAETAVYEMPEAELMKEAADRGYAEATPSDWEEIRGLTDDSTEITITERTYKKIVHRRKKYRFRPSVGTEKEIIVTAPGPEKLLPGCTYSADFAVSVVMDKYGDHIPLERQRRRMESAGLGGIAVKTLYNLCAAVAVHHEGIAEKICQEIFAANRAIHADETPWHIFGSTKDSDGYLWIISNQAGAYYRFEPTRSGKVIVEMLKGYEGPVLSDGYAGYNRLGQVPKIIIANCWAHARRKFLDIRDNYPKECDEILLKIDELFAIERKARDWSELARLRAEESTPTINAIREWLFEHKSAHLPESGIRKAVDYTLKLWAGLTAFLTDTRIPLSNNDAERAIRHGVMGRKNYYGSKTIDGADTAATLYTIIESCKRVELDPRKYMRYVIGENHHARTPLTPLAYAKSIRSQTRAKTISDIGNS